MDDWFWDVFDSIILDDILLIILSKLSFTDLQSARAVNFRWRRVADCDSLYQKLVDEDFDLREKRNPTLSWRELYRLCLDLDLSGLWIDHGQSDQDDDYPDVEFPISIYHTRADGVLGGGGLFPPQALWSIGLPFRLQGSICKLTVSLEIEWPVGYGHSILTAKFDPEDGNTFSGNWKTYPSEMGLGAHVNSGTFMTKRISRHPTDIVPYCSKLSIPTPPFFTVSAAAAAPS